MTSTQPTASSLRFMRKRDAVCRELRASMRHLSKRQRREAFTRGATMPLGTAAVAFELTAMTVGVPAVRDALGVGE